MSGSSNPKSLSAALKPRNYRPKNSACAPPRNRKRRTNCAKRNWRINDVLPRLAADRDLLARLDIRAPAAGQVVDQTVFTKGGVIEPGKTILDIVPSAPVVVAEAEIRPEDIEHLRIGQTARVIATGFNPRETQAMQGRIDIISADRIVDPRNGQAYYKVEVTLVADRDGGRLLRQLTPGMPVEVVVPVKPRTALDYLTEPLRSSFRKAGNEV